MEKKKKVAHRRKDAAAFKQTEVSRKKEIGDIEIERGTDETSKISEKNITEKKTKKRSSFKNKIIRGVLIALCCVVVVALALGAVVFGTFMHYYNKMNYVVDNDITAIAPADIDTMEKDIDELESENYYVRRDITNADGEVIATTYDTIDLSALTDDERVSIEEEVAKELESASEAQKEALDRLASGQPYTPPTTEQDNVLVVKQDDVEREYETKTNDRGEITAVKKDGVEYEVVSNNKGQLIAVKNDGAGHEVNKDDEGNIISIEKNDQKYELGTDDAGTIVVLPPETSASESTASATLSAVSDVYNMLLIGTDLRAGAEGYGKSDAMILVSINRTNKTISMISFMRDLYADIPGYGVDKMNRAYKYGGGPLLMQTIEANYGIHIDNYAAVNFYSLIDIVDSLGGISINISPEEVEVANLYINEMCGGIGENPENYHIKGSGQLLLNGMQTVGYCRIRYVGRYDFERTERQRRVLLTIFSMLQSKSISEIDTFLNTALPKVTHNISSNTLAGLLMNAPAYMGYKVNTYRVPFDGTYHYSGEILVPDFSYTINELYNIINN